MEGFAALVYCVCIVLLALGAMKFLGGKTVTLPQCDIVVFDEEPKSKTRTRVKAKTEAAAEVEKAIAEAVEEATADAVKEAVKVDGVGSKKRTNAKSKVVAEIVPVPEAEVDGRFVPVELVKPVDRRIVAAIIVAQR
jgi:hypothetical protein